MRWSELFADLEGQARALERADLEAELPERTRGEHARITLVDRLRARVGEEVSLAVSGSGRVTGVLQRMGRDWLLLADPDDLVVPVSAVSMVFGLGASSVNPAAVGAVSSRIRLSSAIRALAQDQALVRVALLDGTVVTGTPDRVGADAFDLAVHEGDVAPRPAAVRSRATVAYPALAVLRRVSPGFA